MLGPRASKKEEAPKLEAGRVRSADWGMKPASAAWGGLPEGRRDERRHVALAWRCRSRRDHELSKLAELPEPG